MNYSNRVGVLLPSDPVLFPDRERSQNPRYDRELIDYVRAADRIPVAALTDMTQHFRSAS